MKKMKKGFTLTELIVAISIMTLIVLIVVPAYKNIRRNVLEKQYENIIRLIETASSKYAAKYKTNMLVVQDLIDKGLIETDDGTNIYDPRNKKVLNCYLVEITYKKGNYKAEFTNIKSDSCRVENDIVIIAKNKETGAVVNLEDNKWINHDLLLSVDISEIESSNINYRWTSSYGDTSTEASVSTDVRTVLKTIYNVEVIIQEEQYLSKQEVKIDKEAPIIKDVEISGGKNWETGREVTVKATDQSGSGIKGYYLDKADCNNSSVFQSSNKFNVTGSELYNGENYYLCVKDKAGNITHHNELIYLELEDKEVPTCKIIAENDNWTNEDVTIKLGCEDSISGCDPKYSNYEKTITETAKTRSQTWQIKDNAGNVTNCEETVKVYLDKTAPTITKENITNNACINKHCKSPDTKVCSSFIVQDNIFENPAEFTIHRSYCYNCSDNKKITDCANRDDACEKYTAKNRLNNFLNGSTLSGDNKSMTNCPSCTKQFTFNTSSFGMCTTYGSDFSLQYAFKVCDPVGNCTEIEEFDS